MHRFCVIGCSQWQITLLSSWFWTTFIGLVAAASLSSLWLKPLGSWGAPTDHMFSLLWTWNLGSSRDLVLFDCLSISHKHTTLRNFPPTKLLMHTFVAPALTPNPTCNNLSEVPCQHFPDCCWAETLHFPSCWRVSWQLPGFEDFAHLLLQIQPFAPLLFQLLPQGVHIGLLSQLSQLLLWERQRKMTHELEVRILPVYSSKQKHPKN